MKAPLEMKLLCHAVEQMFALGSRGLTLFPRNWRGKVQKESRVRNRRDRSTSWNSSSSGLMSSWVEDRGGIPGLEG